MKRAVTVNGKDWELFDAGSSIEPAKRGRPRDNEAVRRERLIEKACAEVVGENFMAVAAKYQDEFYGERTVGDKESVEYYNQRKHVAKLLRKLSDK